MALQKKNFRNELRRREVRRMTHISLVSRDPKNGPSKSNLRELGELAALSMQIYGPENKVPL